MLTFGVLGPLEVWADEEEIAVPGPRLRTLLALLLVEPGRVVATAQLSAALWGDHPPSGAEKTVQTYLSRLRRSLDADAASATIVTRAPGYRLQVDPDTVDAVRFARLAQAGRVALDEHRPVEAAATLREALALWRGDAYAEFTDQLSCGSRRTGSRSCAGSPTRTSSTPNSRSAPDRNSSPNWTRSWLRIRTANAGGAS